MKKNYTKSYFNNVKQYGLNARATQNCSTLTQTVSKHFYAMKNKIVLILFIILSLKAECGVILCFDNQEKTYKLTDDRKYLIEIDKKTIRIFNHTSQKFLFEISDIKDQIIQTELSPDNRTLLVVQRNSSVHLYDLSIGKLMQVFEGHTSDVNSAVFSPDSKLILTASMDSKARIYEVSSGKELNVFSAHTDAVTSAVFSPDGKYALTASWDKTARIYEVSTGYMLNVFSEHTEEVNSAVFSPTGEHIMATSDKKTLVWDTEKGNLLGEINHNLYHGKAIFSYDGKTLILYDDKFIYLHNSENLLLIKKISLDPDRPLEHRKIINKIGVTPNNIFTFLDCNNECISWDLNSNSELFAGNFFTNDASFKYDSETGRFTEYSFTNKKDKDNGFFYVLLESRPRIFLISCAADKYNPPLYNLQNCKSDALIILKYF